MTTNDWQELYAANRAAIAAGLGASGAVPGSKGAPDAPAGRSGSIKGTLAGALGDLKGALARGLPGLEGGAAGALPLSQSGSSPGLSGMKARVGLPVLPGTGGTTLPGGDGSWEPLALPGQGSAFVYSPAGLDRMGPRPLLVMLHGCTQTAADFAAGTAMNEAADRHGFVVLYPQQSRQDNQHGCWNWFVGPHQTRDGDEPAFIGGAAEHVLASTDWSIDPARVFVAGLSAGGAMAAIMAATHPDLFAAAAIHSGMAYRSATSMVPALAAMSRGGPDPREGGRAAHQAMGPHARPVPTLIIHGSADRTVAPVNAAHLLEQWRETNALAAPGTFDVDLQAPTSSSYGKVPDGYAYARHRWEDRDGRVRLAHLRVDGLGHAWSGGAPNGSYTDARGPSATEAIVRFFAAAAR